MKLFAVLVGLAVGACALQAKSSSERLTGLVGKPVATAVAEFQAPESVTRINAGQSRIRFSGGASSRPGGRCASISTRLNAGSC
jgi:hypothetical protein